MHKKDNQEAVSSQRYDKSELLRPDKLIVNLGEKSTLLFNNRVNYEVYNKIYTEARKAIKNAVITNTKSDVKVLSFEELGKARSMKGIDMIYSSPLEAEALLQYLDIDINNTNIGAEFIDEIIIATSFGRLYMADSSQNVLYELRLNGTQKSLDYGMSDLEKLSTASSIFLSTFDEKRFGKNVVVPMRFEKSGFPMLLGEKELQAKEEIPESIEGFFQDDDRSSLSIIKNTDGTIVYTNRENLWVKLYTNGMLEYVKYDAQPSGANSVDVKDAVDISTEFINRHFGFPENCYISDIVRSMQGDKYIIRYKYRYEGLPIVLDSGINNDTIEIEIVGNEVRRYKRLVRKISYELESKEVMDSIDVLDILLDDKVSALSGEKIVTINDLFLAYYERSQQDRITYIPVWVADVNVESLDTGTALNQKKRYIINAETGIILDK